MEALHLLYCCWRRTIVRKVLLTASRSAIIQNERTVVSS